MMNESIKLPVRRIGQYDIVRLSPQALRIRLSQKRMNCLGSLVHDCVLS